MAAKCAKLFQDDFFIFDGCRRLEAMSNQPVLGFSPGFFVFFPAHLLVIKAMASVLGWHDDRESDEPCIEIGTSEPFVVLIEQ